MGQYFRFIHENGQVNKKGIAQNFNLSWMKNFHYLDEDQMAEIFKKIVENNRWPPGKVYAKGDDGGFFVYDPEKHLVKELNMDQNSDDE